LMVISNGGLVETKDNGDGFRTYHWKMDTPYTNYLTSIVVGEYTEIRGMYKDTPVSTYVYKDWKTEGEVTAKRLPAMVAYFSRVLDFDYPYTKYAQTIANQFNGGMENITATTQTDNMIIDDRTELDADEDGLQAHELAHQWFGNYVTCRDWSDIWLNEGFATYMEALWQLESKGKDYFLYNEVRGNQNAYYGAWRQGQRRPIVTKNYANPDAVFDTYAYPRGGAVLHMLRKQLGDANFFRALNHYLKTNANEPVQTEDLRIAIEESTGQSMDAFFDQWLYKMGHPVFEVSQQFDTTTGILKLNVKQTQKRDLTSLYPQTEYFQTPVDIEIVTKKGAEIKTVFLEAKEENVFEFELEELPLLVDFDDEGTLIKEIKFEKPVGDLIYQAQNDKDVIGRSWAMSELTRKAQAADADAGLRETVLAVMRKAAHSDTAWQLRQTAVENLAALLSPARQEPGQEPRPANLDKETEQVLIKSAADKDSRVRADSIRLLGATKNPAHYELYLGALRTDRSYSVVDAAAGAIAQTGNEEAYFVLRKLAQTDSWKNRLQISGLNALALSKDKRALDLGFKYAGNKAEPAGLRNAGLRIVSAAGQGDSRAYPLVFNTFKNAFENNSFQTMFTSLEAFINLADPRAQEAFDMMKKKFGSNPSFLGFIINQEKRFKVAVGAENK
ncbi:MAG: M1 family aminopeptidase, partial [Acidobacteriota bacterium]|nr:M1 family aminopeptidase [Acidobacteriota bacterium]